MLPLTNGGTGTQVLNLTAGAVWYTNGSGGFLQTVQGLLGQVLVSGGSGAPGWGSALILANQAANLVYAGPTSGAPAPTSFRLLVNADIPATLSGKSMSGALNTFTAIPNASLDNSSVTYNGVNVALGASGTITASTTAALTIGTGLTGTSFNGSTPITIAIDSTVATLTGSQTLTNKSISGSTNTLSNIGNASLTNSSVTVGTTSISLGASSLTLGGLTSVAVTQDPVSALELATKQYVDAVAQGLDPKASCVAATTANITLSGTQTIDGVALIAGDRCLVKDQTLSQNNGIYLVAAGAWTRAADMDNWLEVPGAFTFIEQGTLYADTGWVCTSNAGGTLGTTPITWIQFAGVGSYTAGTGLTLTGTQFSISNTAVTPASYGAADKTLTATVNAQGQLTALADTPIAIANTQVSGLGTMSTQAANNVAITGGVINGTTIGGVTPAVGTFTTANATTFDTNVAAAGVTLAGVTLAADGTDINIDILVNPKGTGGVGIGGDPTGVVAGNTITSKFCVKHDGAGQVGGFVHANNTAANSGAGIFACRSRGTIASPTVVQNNDRLATISFAGYDGTDLALAAQIDIEVDGAPGNNDMPGRIRFLTTPDGTQAPVEAMRISSAQIVTLANALPIASGGTNGTATPTAGAVPYGTGTAYAFSSAGSSGEFLISGGTGSPTWTNTVSGGTYA